MATDRPLPPFLPESLAQYEEHASLNPEAWYQYFQAAYQFIDQRDTGQDTGPASRISVPIQRIVNVNG